ncbi:MAG TPA: hypothetical protein VIO61_02880 [Anaerolineaceae bacterium]
MENFSQNSAPQSSDPLKPARRRLPAWAIGLIFIGALGACAVLAAGIAGFIWYNTSQQAAATLTLIPDTTATVSASDLKLVQSILQQRLDHYPLRGAKVQVKGDHLEMTLTDAGQTSTATRLAAARGLFQIVDAGSTPLKEGSSVPTSLKVILTNNDVKEAKASVDSTGRAIVEFQLTQDATARFFTHTSTNVGKYAAIIIDGKVLSCPIIQSAIPGGKAVISSNLTQDDARVLASQIASQPLPFRFNVMPAK